MFHIPFDEREKAAGDRYSISGTPCLYLACNTFVAQCELHVNNISKNTFYSAFEPSIAFLNKRIIDLSVPDNISDISSGPTYTEGGVVKLRHRGITEILKKSPAHLLNIACMIKCKEKNRNFKSEYVIPQLIMCCLRKMHCVGVAYESTCFSQNIHMLKSCFAFPAFQQQKSAKQYLKQLANSFKMTKGNSVSFFIRFICH